MPTADKGLLSDVRDLVVHNFVHNIKTHPDSGWLSLHDEETAALFLFVNAFAAHYEELDDEECHDENHRLFRILSPEAYEAVETLYAQLLRDEFPGATTPSWRL